MADRVSEAGGLRRVTLGAALALVAALAPGTAALADGDEPDEAVTLPGGELERVAPAEPEVSPPSIDLAQPPLLETVTSGEQALHDLAGDLDEAAARNGMTPDELTRLLLEDSSVHLDPHGRVFFVDPAPGQGGPVAAAGDVVAAPFPYDQTFLLNSKPGSKKTIYLDFTGHSITDNWWQVVFALPDPYTVAAFDTNGDPSTFSNAERDIIQSVWQRVAEDYKPFDVNVTTQAPTFAALDRSSASDAVYGTRAVVSGSDPFCFGCAGIAFLGVFNDIAPYHALYQPLWCFATVLDGAKQIAECLSHETGHTVGLSHDGESPGDGDYYLGHGPWAPIMGVAALQPVSQFSKGDYANATETEDDFAVVANHGLVERGDDHTNVTSTATVLTSARSGTISSRDDYDTFRFNAPETGTVTFVATTASVSPNLDIELNLYSSSVNLLDTSAPPVVRVDDDVATGMGASIEFTVEAGKSYYLQVSGDNHLNASTGFPRYGSVGAYRIVAEGMTGMTTCGGLVVTILGTGASGTVNGTSGDDVIDAGAGADVVNGFGGDDVICGGPGADTLNGGGGHDKLYAGTGSDVVRGAAGADLLKGGEGADELLGQLGVDTLYGGSGEDDLIGGGGDDGLYGEAGGDTLTGGNGADDLRGGLGADMCRGGAGIDSGLSCEVETGIP